MTLGDAAIDEYSRHVLVPEIGPSGQTRLLDTRVRVWGDHASRPLVGELLARSGLRVVDEDEDVSVLLGAAAPGTGALRPSIVGWGSDDVVHATALMGRPCPGCVALPVTSLPTSPPAVQALAALVVTVLVLRVVTPASASSDVGLDLCSGRLETEWLAESGCARCTGRDRP